MKKLKKLSLFLLFLLFFSLRIEASSSLKHQMLSDLFFLKNVCAVKYAPAAWKSNHLDWQLEKGYEEAKNKILKLPSPTLKDYQRIVKSFLHTFKDYHVGIHFHSTEEAILPFTIRGAEGRYFIVNIDSSKSATGLALGDEILFFNGKPIHEAIQEIKKREIGDNSPETDQAIAELILTYRRGEVGDLMPEGPAELVVKKKNSDTPEKLEIAWSHTPEKIKDVSRIPYPAFGDNSRGRDAKNSLFDQVFMHSAFCTSNYLLAAKENRHAVGAKKSFIPPLGKKLWVEEQDKIFHSYIFELPLGDRIARIGYLRLAHYYAEGEKEMAELAQIIEKFQAETDAVILDQLNNPGGSVFYFYAIASLFTDTPLTLPKHRIILTQEEIQAAAYLLTQLEKVQDDHSAREELGENMGGYPVDYHFAKTTEKFCRFLLAEWNTGNRLSRPTHLFGVDVIQPHAKARYTKPILLLINSLDFSGGDFFPAILQDNKRALLLGSRTAGAGGYVLGVKYPNLLGVRKFSLTGSLALRANEQPIENLGVVPDIPYSLKVEDFTQNYAPYREKIVEAISFLLENSSFAKDAL